MPEGVEDIEEVLALTMALVARIRELPPGEPHGPAVWGYERTRPNHGDVARRMCHLILDELQLDGMGGCRLCCS